MKAITSEQAKEEGRQDDMEENDKDISPPPKEEEDKKFKDIKDVRFLVYFFFVCVYNFFYFAKFKLI